MVGDGLYFEAPFINFCQEQRKDVVVVVKGDHRLLLQDAEGLFSQRAADGQWSAGRRTVQYGDSEGFTSCEGVVPPLRVLHTLETERRRERIAGPWKPSEKTSSWYWATTFSQQRLPVRQYWQAGHWRWDIENGCFNSTSTHGGLDHVFRHEPPPSRPFGTNHGSQTLSCSDFHPISVPVAELLGRRQKACSAPRSRT